MPFDEGMEVIHQQRSCDAGEASVLIGADDEMQQESGRIVATIPNALPSVCESPRSLILLPWHYGRLRSCIACFGCLQMCYCITFGSSQWL